MFATFLDSYSKQLTKNLVSSVTRRHSNPKAERKDLIQHRLTGKYISMYCGELRMDPVIV